MQPGGARVAAEVGEMVLLELEDTPRVSTVLCSAGERIRVEVKAGPTTKDGEVVVRGQPVVTGTLGTPPELISTSKPVPPHESPHESPSPSSDDWQ